MATFRIFTDAENISQNRIGGKNVIGEKDVRRALTTLNTNVEHSQKDGDIRKSTLIAAATKKLLIRGNEEKKVTANASDGHKCSSKSINTQNR